MIHAWAKSGAKDYLKRSQDLFDEVHRLRAGDLTSYTYAAYQIAWSRSGRLDAPSKVESLLTQMQREYEQHGDFAGRPKTPNFAAAIKAWAHTPGGAERAEAMLKHLETSFYANQDAMQHLKPTIDCYKSAMLGWGLNGGEDGGRRAVELLDHMDRLYDVDPTAPRPDYTCYHQALMALGRSSYDNKAEQSYRILQRMKVNKTAPINNTYCVFFRSCGATQGKGMQEAANVALTGFSDFTSDTPAHEQSDSVYERFLVAMFYLLRHDEQSKDDALVEAMQHCPPHLLQSWKVVHAVRNAVSRQAAARILGEEQVEQQEV